MKVRGSNSSISIHHTNGSGLRLETTFLDGKGGGQAFFGIYFSESVVPRYLICKRCMFYHVPPTSSSFTHRAYLLLSLNLLSFKSVWEYTVIPTRTSSRSRCSHEEQLARLHQPRNAPTPPDWRGNEGKTWMGIDHISSRAGRKEKDLNLGPSVGLQTARLLL